MRILMSVVVCGLLLSLTACGKKDATSSTGGGGGGGGDKPKELIIGVWEIQDKDAKGTMEFKKDGTLVQVVEIAGMKLTANGTYKFVEEDVIETEIKPPVEGAPSQKEKVKVTKVTKDELVTKDSKGKEDKFKRAK